jgi:hypothetical protein
MRLGVVDGADPPVQQVGQLFQRADRVAGRVLLIAGDLDQELLLDSVQDALGLPPAHRAAWLAVGQLDARHRACPGQRFIGKARAVVGIQGSRDAVAGDRGAQHGGEPDRVGAADELVPRQEPGVVIDDGGQVTAAPARLGAVGQVRGPDLVDRISLEPAEGLRRLPAGTGEQLPGREPPLDRSF